MGKSLLPASTAEGNRSRDELPPLADFTEILNSRSGPRPMGGPERPIQVGGHAAWLEGDILGVRFVGPYLPEEARQILSLADQIYREHGRVFLLADVSQSVPPGPETRRIIGTWSYLGRYAAVAFGANLAIRTIFRLVVSAQSALGYRSPILTHIAASEAEARTWIAEQRRLAPDR